MKGSQNFIPDKACFSSVGNSHRMSQCLAFNYDFSNEDGLSKEDLVEQVVSLVPYSLVLVGEVISRERVAVASIYVPASIGVLR